ncbi:AraC-type DNA-binding protein [Tenacibaculum sp. MAR_2009_124]|uniref:helix-turn-helix domain-containing protein n=1 Tax=Tenacibaculum sp. MAR_2009_124 TaxID=1250059 RepID=UPI0008966B36|nr:AraC family transcriptional regulator [Tenacibaculum sp. MAR_2009_124]SED23356.1 AraC-type DNA-binding protein [Tenacibaculum sp. MAR_2009_124]
MRNPEITTYEPKNKLLSNYIHFYYDYTLKDEEYFAFPSGNTIVIAIENSVPHYVKNQLYLAESPKHSTNFFALNKFSSPLLVKTKGKIREFVIIFKPHGLAQFITCNVFKKVLFEPIEFNKLLDKHPDFFDYSMERKIDLFETFLLQILDVKQGIDIITKAIQLISERDLSIEEVASACNCSYKKLYRLFKLHCGVTPITLKKNIRFRKVLKKIKTDGKKSKLSDIALDFGFYDQALFNKAFKQLTGENPKSFLKNVRILSESDMYFKTLK